MLDAAGEPIAERYIESARLLARLHAKQTDREIVVDPTVSHRIPDFDRTAMKIETRLLIDWYLPWKRGEPASDDEKREYSDIWTA